MAEGASTAPPLTIENILTAVQGVAWRKLGEKLTPRDFNHESLQLEYPKLDEIAQQHQSDDSRLHAVIECWLQGEGLDEEPSWRRIILALDGATETRAAADTIRLFAEPLPDPTLTVENVREVMAEVGDWWSVGMLGLGVPDSKRQEIKQQSSTEREKSLALGDYWVNTDPDASWERLARKLYRWVEDRAVAVTRQYLQQADPTLTTDNLMEVVKEVEHRWEELGLKLGLRSLMINVDGEKIHGMADVVDEYVRRCPIPSWKQVATVLQEMKLDKLADEVTTKYVRASEKSKEMFDEAMTHGYVEARDIKALIFGAAGTGKTHTIALLMDEEPSAIRRSTPCATRPVRVDKLEEEGGKWVRVTHDQLSQTIADTSTMLPQNLSTARKATSSTPSSAHTPVGTSESKTASKPKTASTKNATAASTTCEEVSSVSSSSAEDELLRRIEMSPYGRRVKKAFKCDRITLIDTGGQPQFHEVLPMFMGETSASMFTIKLDDSLDDHPLIEFYDDSGHLVGSYRSPFTNQQILMMCMRVIQSQASQSQEGLCPTPIFVGTHKDLEQQCTSETREDKNQRIHDMLPPAVQYNAIYCDKWLKELIFAVNAKTPGPHEKKIAAELRRVIVERSRVKPKRIPLRWHALELALQKLMLELGRGVLSKAEGLAVARRFHFTDESFEEALKYLHNLNILFYYKDVLPNVIFCDPQVLLDKVTELVEHSYRLQTGACQHIAAEGDLRRFRDQGIVTLELLSKKEFRRHYVQSLFSPGELLRLFEKLLIVSPITEEEFLMPCLLQVTQEPTPFAPSSSVPPLLFYFPHSPLLGVFCALVAYLLSQAKWKLLFDAGSRSPVKVDRNTVQFEVPGDLAGVITLSDSFLTYFQVSIQLPEKAPRALYSAVLPQIRETIVAGIRKASSALNYNNSVPKDAFFCLEHGTSVSATPHASIVDRTHTLMTCTLNPGEVCSTLTEEHLVWFHSGDTPNTPPSGAASQPSSMTCSASGVVTTSGILHSDVAGPPSPNEPKTCPSEHTTTGTQEPQMKDLVLIKVTEWYELGLQLGVDDAELEEIEKNNRGDLRACRRNMFRAWLKITTSPSYQQLVEALMAVGEGKEADLLCKKYSNTPDTPPSGAARQPSSMTCSASGVVTTSDTPCSGAARKPSSMMCCPSGKVTTADMKPSMAQLTMLKNAKGEKVEIIKTIAPDWMEVGFLMDLDPKGRKIANIEAEHALKRNGPVVCCREMFILWLDRPDATWGNLIKLLVDAEQKDLAEQVEDAVGL